MAKPREDHRVRMTKRILKSALIDLMKEKPLSSITVKELCERADINRGTFYSHYADIYALREEIEDDMFDEIQHALALYQPGDTPLKTPFSIYIAVFMTIKNNSDMTTILLNETTDRRLIVRALELGKETCIQMYQAQNPATPVEQIEWFYAFVSNGFIGVLQRWIDDGLREPIDRIANMMDSIITGAGQHLQGVK